MNHQERLLLYLGTDKNLPHEDMNEFCIKNLSVNVNTHDTKYDVPLKKLLIKTNHTGKRFSFARGDIINKEQQNNWTLCKNRCENNNSSVILRCFNFDRHWKRFYNRPKDIPFQNKKNAIFWRGTTTGASNHFSAKMWDPRQVNRFQMIETWFNTSNDIDVGFSFIHRDWLKPKYEKYVKGSCQIEKFLEYKYILSIEGNDKDSGLNWKLNSNSLVFMPKPRVTSWLLENTLEAGKHYILLKDDFSDLHDKILFCNNHQDMCIQIIKNANAFMSQFSDNLNEEKLELDVINQYFILKNKLTESRKLIESDKLSESNKE
jgi:hypothetical protein